MPLAPPFVHLGDRSQEPRLNPGAYPHHQPDTGGGVWDYLFPGEQRQGLGVSCSDGVLDRDGTGPNELHSRGWCASIARWVPGSSVTTLADCRGGEALPEERPHKLEDANPVDHGGDMDKGIEEVGSISRRRKCKGLYRIWVKRAACHGRGCCGGT